MDLDFDEMGQHAGGNTLTWMGAGISGGSSILSFIDNNAVGVGVSAISLGGFAVIGVYVAWIDRVSKARIKAEDDAKAAEIRRLKAYEKEFHDSLQGQVAELTKELEETRAELANVIADRNYVRQELIEARAERERISKEMLEIREKFHRLRNEMAPLANRVEVAEVKADRAQAKTDKLSDRLKDSHVIEDGSDEHIAPTPGPGGDGTEE